MMTSRERVIATINHEEPDYVPLDLGGCGQTGMNASTVYKLRKAYGLAEHPITISEPYQMLGTIDKDLLKRVGGDVLPLWNPTNLMGLSNNYTKPWNMFDGTPVLMPDNFAYTQADTGDIYAYPAGDTSAECSFHMPKDGNFFNNINRSKGFDEKNLTPIEDFKDQYTLFSEEACHYWEASATQLFEDTEYAIMGCLGGVSYGDPAEIPGSALKKVRGIRSIADWLMAHLLYPDYIEAVFAYQTEVALKNLEMYRQAVGDKIQTIWLSGTDLGTQHGTFISKKAFVTLYKPFYTKINQWVHKNTNWKTFYHSCGAVYDFIPEFIDMGVDILNPVQCSARGMEATNLKAKFGKDIVFWGGGVDTQKTLPFGTKSDVEKEVKERLNIFTPNGGFVFAAIHNVVANVPIENVVTMFDTVNEFRGM